MVVLGLFISDYLYLSEARARKAVQQLISDIPRNYDTVLGLKGEIEKLGSEQRSAEKALEEAEKRVQAQNRLYLARKAQIEAYERLKEKGVDGDILRVGGYHIQVRPGHPHRHGGAQGVRGTSRYSI